MTQKNFEFRFVQLEHLDCDMFVEVKSTGTALDFEANFTKLPNVELQLCGQRHDTMGPMVAFLASCATEQL